ncbi:MAG: [FeFe] hydrogenase H-cluster radical SAM maturase HydE [Rikenellaceae bacterium]|nr:[FeFe] hydrogenase H-cluster radical SAM maturase HydE [Rikenellaceae bacterium]
MEFTFEHIVSLLRGGGEELFAEADRVRRLTVGDGIHLRGLIEYTNICHKNCLYCGIRRDSRVARYTLTDDQVIASVRYAVEQGFGSVVIQGGEICAEAHVEAIERIVRRISGMDGPAVVLSLGEQTAGTYRRWFDAGASRYLLRIESSDPALYARIHPADHSFDRRLEALRDLRRTGYEVGTGVMIGLPWQSVESLAHDLLFMRKFDIDMCGMGPYLECDGTPLASFAHETQGSQQWRGELTLRMIAILRLMMPDINIASTTALQAISPDMRLRGLSCGANVAMPNISPSELRANYVLYDNKPVGIDPRILEMARPNGVNPRGRSMRFMRRECNVI